MNKRFNSRRKFSKNAVLTGAAACFMPSLPAVASHDALVTPDVVKFGNGIEPTVQLIEKTPRGSIIEVLAKRIQGGMSYREVLAGLLLAGVRNVQPRPSVGFKFHCVLVINSCHLASLSGPDSDRWLPILWAVDYFKSSQSDETRQSGWKMSPVKESGVPAGKQAKQLFVEAMESWDVEKADLATAGLCRTVGATDVFNLFAEYAARDYRSIGHKAIYLANAWRTLQVIGWKFSEPVMRSLAFALLNHTGAPNPAKNDLSVDRPWRENKAKIGSIPDSWIGLQADESTTRDLIATFRQRNPGDSSDFAAKALKGGKTAQAVWDGVFLGAGELLMRQPGIIGLHGLTTANAMHYLWKNAQDPALRKRLLLQACSFNPLFRESAKARGALRDRFLDALIDPKKDGEGTNSINTVLADISKDPMKAAVKLRAYLDSGGNSHAFVHESRKVLFQKGKDAHDYKFSSAVLEDYAHVSPKWRDEFLAMSVFNLKGTGHGDNRLYQRIKNNLKD